MYKFLRLTIYGIILFVCTVSAHKIPTPDPRLTCTITEKSSSETQKFFHNKEIVRYLKLTLSADTVHHLLAMFATNVALGGSTGHHTTPHVHYTATPDEIEKHNTLKNLHEKYRLLDVKIVNNSDTILRLEKDKYIASLATAATAFTKLRKLYPNFTANKISNYILMALFGITAGTAGYHTITTSNNRFASGFGTLILGLIAYWSWWGAQEAGRLQTVIDKIFSFTPTVTTKDGDTITYEDEVVYRIAPGDTFTDTLCIHIAGINASASIFGNQTGPTLTPYED